MKKILLRYKYVFVMIFIYSALFKLDAVLARKAIETTQFSLKEMLMVIPPIFILLGLLDVWVPKETMTRFMGEGSGIKGVLLSFFIGSAAAGPLYGAFPVAAVFMKKGVSFQNVMIFIGAWSTTKIPMFLFEMSALGAKFALLRLALNIPGIYIMTKLMVWFNDKKEISRCYERALSEKI